MGVYLDVPKSCVKKILYDKIRTERVTNRELEFVGKLSASCFSKLLKIERFYGGIEITYQSYDYTLRDCLVRLMDMNCYLTELGVMVILSSLLRGLFFLHSLDLIHRNLCPDSIYVNQNGDIYIGGLDLIRSSLGPMTMIGKYGESKLGVVDVSSPYLSPECISSDSYDITIDSWSLGIILIEFCNGKFLERHIVDKYLNGFNIDSIAPNQVNTYISKRVRSVLLPGFRFNEKLLEIIGKLTFPVNHQRIRIFELVKDQYILQMMILCRDIRLFEDGKINPIIVTNKFEVMPPLIPNIIDKSDSEKDLEIIGSGGSGTIYKVRKNEVILAKKVVNIPRNDVSSVYHELDHCHDLFHDNIILTLTNLTYKNDDSLNIFLEYCDLGDLHSFLYIRESGRNSLSELGIFKIFCSILNGLYYMHSNHYIHRDIKPYNILVTSGGSLLISDLGSIYKIKKDELIEERRIFTTNYCAPELIYSQKYDEKVDIYSFGMTMYNLLTSCLVPPLQIMRNSTDIREFFNFSSISDTPYFIDIFYKMIDFDQTKRISTMDLINDEKIATYNFLTKKMRFVVNGEMNPSFCKDNQTFIQDSRNVYFFNWRDLIMGKTTFINTEITVDDINSIDVLSKFINDLFPEINRLSQIESYFNLDLLSNNFINRFSALVNNVLTILGININKNREYSWGSNYELIGGIHHMLQIINYLKRKSSSDQLTNFYKSTLNLINDFLISNTGQNKGKIMELWNS